MARRGISPAKVDAAMARPSFSYWHESQWKIGYYDPATKVFVGKTIDGTVNTVIGDATPGYIKNLKKAQP